MKYRIVRFYSLPCECYRFKIQKKILWWWKDENFSDFFHAFKEFTTAVQAEKYLNLWLLGKEKPQVVKFLQINEK